MLHPLFMFLSAPSSLGYGDMNSQGLQVCVSVHRAVSVQGEKTSDVVSLIDLLSHTDFQLCVHFHNNVSL